MSFPYGTIIPETGWNYDSTSNLLTFTETGKDFTITTNADYQNIDYLVVGGGGGCGTNGNLSGAGGGYVNAGNLANLTAGNYQVSVGAGGISDSNAILQKGGLSKFWNYNANGGFGAVVGFSGIPGGSGGTINDIAATPGANGTAAGQPGQPGILAGGGGHAWDGGPQPGGDGGAGGPQGGGGGSGGMSWTVSGGAGGAGGDGTLWSVTGLYYGGGGGGGNGGGPGVAGVAGPTGGPGGLGGGGNGGGANGGNGSWTTPSNPSTPPLPNRGGGAGARGNSNTFYNGGDGVVILSFGTNVPISNICFPKGTPIMTDQGNICIEKLIPNIHTIRNKKIVGITKTITQDKHLVCFEKDAIGKNLPSQKTIISKNHKILYKGKMMAAKEFLIGFEDVKRVKYTGEILYNVLMEKYDKIVVNNLICESLDPENSAAKLYHKLQGLTIQQQNEFINKINKHSIENNVFSSSSTFKKK
jgi:hypothetical protein